MLVLLPAGNVRPVKMDTTVAERAWWAYHCLPRDKRGKPPAATRLESSVGLGRGTLGRLFSGERVPIPENLEKAATALEVTSAWLTFGEGVAPSLTGPLPPRPGTDVPAWQPPSPPPEVIVEKPVRYENLRRVVTSMRGERPDEFLDEVLVSAALYSPTDLPEMSWKAMLDGLYAEWRGKAEPDVLPADEDPVAEAMAEARRKLGKKGVAE